MSPIILIILGLMLFGSGVVEYLLQYTVVKTKTEIVRVYTDKDNAITRVTVDGSWDGSVEWIKNKINGE